MPFYVGCQRELPKGKRGRCIVEALLHPDEIKLLRLKLPIGQQVDYYGWFVFETWECPKCHGNIHVEDIRNIMKHSIKCTGAPLQSGAYISPTKTTSGKRFSAKKFMTHEDIIKLSGGKEF